MPTKVSSGAIKRARQLRRSMTDDEKKLCSELKQFRRRCGIHVRRQAPIAGYYPDFAIHERRLIIEVDGERHFTVDGLARDTVRDGRLELLGYRVPRFNTCELAESFDGCVEEILGALGLMSENPAIAAPPLVTPPLKGEGNCATPTPPSPLRGRVRGGGHPEPTADGG